MPKTCKVKKKRFTFAKLVQCNPDIRDPDIREMLSGPKLKHVLPKQNRPKPDIRDLFYGPDNSLISVLHCIIRIFSLSNKSVQKVHSLSPKPCV